MKKIRLLSIVGTRPQIIKASAISRAISNPGEENVEEFILHTGQHYDREMSGVFFEELEIPKPDYNLGVGSARHGKQTASMISGIEEIILKEKPDAAIIYGDTNSTLAAAIAASKLKIPLIHIEAGLRSYTKYMPEEVNRILSDHVSTLLFAPTDEAFKNLMREGFRPGNSPPYHIDNPKIFLAGDIMYDNSLFFAELAEKKLEQYIANLGLQRTRYILATIHRDLNTDNPERLEQIMRALINLSTNNNIKLVMPLHPRTVNALMSNNKKTYALLNKCPEVIILPPASYLEMILLEKNSAIIMTDSGGVQKEAHFFSKPCVVFRKETEWVELVRNKTAILADSNEDKIIKAYASLMSRKNMAFPGFYGNGKSSDFILGEIIELCTQEHR
ncbi:MAG TPA: UDP-N-acetylglucosamine 2-epimerase (non-hydrolyzing) [Bacteroidales bacterium]|nr:UDP-N-acetylglucosamine 2-epimerase (non-hydrolyzing) [Bacteroidales bacterium]